MDRPRFSSAFLHPRYWPLWFGLGLLWLVVQLPYPVLLMLGRGLGALMYRLVGSRREIAARNLELCFPEKSPAERERLLKENFASSGIAFFEMAMSWWWPKARLARLAHIEGLEHLREAQAQGGFAALTDAQVAALTERCMDACMQTYLPQGDARASREGYLSTRNRQEAAAVVLDVARELRLSQFTPAAEELTFAPGGQMPPIVYHASRGDGLLTGKIDRVDTYEKDGTTYFRIVDYKTGRKDFSYTDLLYGKDLQMLLYLFALQENQKKAGHPMQPAGALYVPGRCDMIRLEPGEDVGEADAERRKQLRRKGLGDPAGHGAL